MVIESDSVPPLLLHETNMRYSLPIIACAGKVSGAIMSSAKGTNNRRAAFLLSNVKSELTIVFKPWTSLRRNPHRILRFRHQK